jgi:hypothetical protein
MAGVQINVSILNQPLLHIFRESTFDGLIFNVFHFGKKFVYHNIGHSINYILNKLCNGLQIVFSA